MIDPHILELSLAIETMAPVARNADDLAASIRHAYPQEPIPILRRAIFYAVTDPDRRDGAATLKLFDAAYSMLIHAELHAV